MSPRLVLLAAIVAAPALLAQKPAPKGAKPAVASDTTPDSVSKFVAAFGYRGIGPAAYSGRVTSIAVPATSEPRPKTFYIGAAGGGVWKTTNGGVTWQSASKGLGSETIGDLAVAPSDSNVVWVGTGEKNSLRSQYWGDGVYKSTDGGRKWTKMGLADSRAIGKIVIHPTDANVVYVAALGHLWGPNAERGVYKTTDGGKTWARVLFVDDTTGFIDLAMDPRDANVLYAASWHRLRWGGSHMQGVGKGSGIFKTTDGGKTWTKLTDPKLDNGLPTDRMGRIGLAISDQDSRIVYAMVEVDRGVTDATQGRFGGVFRSSDAGAHWTQVNDLQAEPHYYYDAIFVDPADSQHVFVNSPALLESKDGGRTFAPESLAHVHGDHHALWFDPHDKGHRILGNDGGAYVTFDGGKAWWHMPLPIGQFYTMIVDSSQVPYQVCGGLQDNGVWCGPSATRDTSGIADADWYPVNGGDGMWVQVPPKDPFTVYSGWQYGNVSRLDLRTWKRDDIVPMSLDAGAESGYPFAWGWTTPILISRHDTSVVYLGANRLFRLRKGGDDWEAIGPDMTRNPREKPAPEDGHTSYHAIFSIAESPRTAAVLWTGSDDGNVWVTRDTGRTWVNATAKFPKSVPADCFVQYIAASAHADGTAWVALDCHHRDDYRPHVLRTTDFGASWTEMVNGLPADRGSLIVFESPRNPRVLWVGTSDGLYATVDGGQRWRRFGKDFPNVMVEALSMSYAQRDLVVGTHGRGVYIVNVGALEEYSDSLLGENAHLFEVAPAYQFRWRQTHPGDGSFPYMAPNPPRGAEIYYYLRTTQTEGVKLTITSASGDTVRTITGSGMPGLQRVTWDLSSQKPRPRGLGDPTSRQDLQRVLPGTYTVTLALGEKKLVQKIVVSDLPGDRMGRVR